MLEPGVDEAVGLMERSLYRFADLLAGADDAERPVPGMDWTVADVGAHLAEMCPIYGGLPAGGAPGWADHTRGAEYNAAVIASARTRDPVAQAEIIREATPGMVAAYRRHGAAAVRWNGGIEVPGPSVAAMVANECLIHGLDVARALKRPWMIADADSMTAIRGLAAVMPYFVDRQAAAGFRGTYSIRFRGGPGCRFVFDDGDLVITEERGPADCRLSAAPTAFNLVGYGRIPLWRAVGTGGIVAYGRKPWLGFTFPKLLLPA